ncbi:hypothetical protein MesoLjLc_55170 [Mesorhizobium sp. L-8-10]|uniref:hypothetical protein n=1 Tax=unclassified Mesorhizobium TaxID=325217 RepID=UPI001925FED1|nr:MULTISPECIES: hypothetical protein [unclassified Mesorhizobium]BCH25588.1 hypothetical protein MesoLjLb_53730 [Mesorhizobium sp. L-8-3]BCH33587.1 hypothetical protein MesoLjLc_55170 [Mesorhizobium sp. L-8-10]
MPDMAAQIVGLLYEVDDKKKQPPDPKDGAPPEPEHGGHPPRDTRDSPSENPEGEELEKPVNGAVGDALKRRGR